MDRRRLLSPTGTTLAPLEKKVYQGLKQLKAKLEDQTVIVAVSGGIDSVVLLHVLNNLKSRLGFKIHAAHVNHGVRGKAADADARFVARLARRLKIPLSQMKLKGLPPSAGENLMRRMRYEALFDIKDKVGANFVATAHHEDDLLETRLMRLLQGTGIHGLQAMTMLNDDLILRPFLGVTRREIEEYAKAKDVEWCNDVTNEDTRKLRNWIRRSWLGILRAERPEYVQNLHEGLERLVRNNPPLPKLSPEFDRQSVLNSKSENEIDNTIYNYLRQHSKQRVTSRHVAEFKKLIRSKRNRFQFRLAGSQWQVEKRVVRPA